MNQRHFEALAAAALKAGGGCCAGCGKPATGVGIYVPTDQPVPGKVGMMPYPLCDECACDPGLRAQVEEEVERRLSGFVITGVHLSEDASLNPMVCGRVRQPSMS